MSRPFIVADSTADFPMGVVNGQRIRVVAGHTPDAFLNAYKKAGPKILSLSAPMKLGGDFLPAERAKEKVPFHFEVRTLDSQTLSLGLGFLVIMLAEKAEAGMNLDALEVEAKQLISKVRLYGAVDSNSSWLGAKPIISIKDGKVVTVERNRSKAKSLERLLEIVAAEGALQKVGVIHADAEAEAKELAKRLKTVYPDRNIPVVKAGTAISSHVGSDFVGICGILK